MKQYKSIIYLNQIKVRLDAMLDFPGYVALSVDRALGGDGRGCVYRWGG